MDIPRLGEQGEPVIYENVYLAPGTLVRTPGYFIDDLQVVLEVDEGNNRVVLLSSLKGRVEEYRLSWLKGCELI